MSTHPSLTAKFWCTCSICKAEAPKHGGCDVGTQASQQRHLKTERLNQRSTPIPTAAQQRLEDFSREITRQVIQEPVANPFGSLVGGRLAVRSEDLVNQLSTSLQTLRLSAPRTELESLTAQYIQVSASLTTPTALSFAIDPKSFPPGSSYQYLADYSTPNSGHHLLKEEDTVNSTFLLQESLLYELLAGVQGAGDAIAEPRNSLIAKIKHDLGRLDIQKANVWRTQRIAYSSSSPSNPSYTIDTSK